MTVGRIEQRAARVSFVNGLSTVVTLVFQLVSVPICLKYWGKENYGGWLALFSTFMIMRSLDGGFVIYVGNKLNLLYHQDAAALQAHLSSAVTGIVVIGSLQLALAIATVVFQPLGSVLGIPVSFDARTETILGLLTLTTSWVLTGSYLGIVHRLMIPAGLMYQAAWWAMGFQVTQFIAIIMASVFKLDLFSTSILFAVAQMTMYVGSGLYIRRKLPQFYPWVRGVRLRLGLRDLAQSSSLTVSNLIQQGGLNGIVLVIAALAGPAAVPVFTTVRTLTNLWTAVTTVLTAPLLPEVVRIHAKGEVAKLAAINEAFWVLVGSMVNAGALLSYPLIPYLYGLWTRNTVALDRPLLSLMLAAVVVTNAGALIALHLNGINSLRVVLASSIARAILGIGGGVLGYRFIGLAGFGIGILAAELAVALLMGRHFFKHEIEVETGVFMTAGLGPVLLSTGSAVVFLVCAAFGWWSSVWSWLIAVSGVTGAFIWGWSSLGDEIRDRMTVIALKWSPI